MGAIGLGCMGMSWAYGPGSTPEEAHTVLRRALELGVNHWDTADLYGNGANEELIGPLVRERRDEVFLATKFGNVYDRSLTSHQDQVEAQAPWIIDCTPAYIHKCVDLSLQRLGVEVIDLYYAHRIDPKVPIEETVGAMAELVQAGKVRTIGISEAAASTIRRANSVHPIAAVQNELSLWTRDFVQEEIPATEALGIAFVAYSPLGRGFLTGAITNPSELPDNDFRKHSDRMQGENLAANLKIVEAVRAIADAKNVTPAQVALAWVLGSSPNVVAIPGTRRVSRLEENAAAADLPLTPEERSVLDALGDAAGERYPAMMMAFAKQ